MGDYIYIIICGLTYFMSWNSIIRTVNSLQAGWSKTILTMCLLLIWWLRIAGAIFHLFHMPALSAEEQLYLTLPMNCITVSVQTEESKNQLDSTWYFFVLIGSTCFDHYYVHHQELATMMLFTTLIISFLVCCMLEVRCG